MAKITVTKFDAIRSQLDAAIEMYFVSDNAIATHTLASAAYNALRDIASRQGTPHPFIKRDYIDSLPESRRAAVIKALNEPENFFKHADRDPHDTISLDPELTELFLIDAIAYFRDSSEPRPKYYDIFKGRNGDRPRFPVRRIGRIGDRPRFPVTVFCQSGAETRKPWSVPNSRRNSRPQFSSLVIPQRARSFALGRPSEAWHSSSPA